MSLIARMIEDGVSADIIEEVALLVAEKRAIDERRARDAQRKRDERAASKDVQGRARTSGTSRTGEEKSDTSSENIYPPSPPKGGHSPQRKSRAVRLPDGWEPEPLTGEALAMVSRWQPGELERELAKFKNYWLAKGGAAARKTDWQRTWVNWLIRHDEDLGKRNGQRHSTGDEPRNPKVRAAMRLIDGDAAGQGMGFG